MNAVLKRLAAAGCAALLLAGCSSAPSSSQSQEASSQSQETSSQGQEASSQTLSSVDAPLAVNRLGEKMLAQLASPEENAFFSPLSFYLALSMLHNGAAGTTGEELAALLGVQPGEEGLRALNEANGQLQEQLALDGEDGTLRVGNSLWLRDSFAGKVKADFTGAVEQFYSGQVEALDMTSQEAVETINQWVSQQTGGLIRQGVESLDPNLQALLLNTVYWKALWQTPFSTDATAPQAFQTPQGEKQVEMMHGSLELPYYEDDRCQAAALPCQDGRTSMILVLPKEGAEEELLLTADFLDTLQKEMSTRKVELSLPRMDLAQSFRANDLLTALGAGTMFSANADLTGISEEGDLAVSEVKHDAVLKVDEEGAEAAGSTSVAVVTKAAPPVEPAVMTVDRPFQLAVMDGETGTALFEGAIVDPQP